MKKPAGSLIVAGLASVPVSGDPFRESLCVFVSGYPGRRLLAEVSVESALRQMPGVRIAVSSQASEFKDYQA